MAKTDSSLKRFHFRNRMIEQIKELSDEMGISETEVLENAFNLYYTQEVLPEHIVLGRITQMQEQITAADRKLETLAGIFYSIMPYIFGVLPPLPKNETASDGHRFNPALDKGNDIFGKLVINYRNQVKTHKISFMQNVWADMQENLEMTNTDAKYETKRSE